MLPSGARTVRASHATDNGNKGTDNGNKGTDNGNKGTDNGNKGRLPTGARTVRASHADRHWPGPAITGLAGRLWEWRGLRVALGTTRLY
jgi:hypothetical protein